MYILDEFKPEVESESDDEETIEKDEEGIDEVSSITNVEYLLVSNFKVKSVKLVSYYVKILDRITKGDIVTL